MAERDSSPKPGGPQAAPPAGRGWIVFLLILGFLILTELFRAPAAQNRISYSEFLSRLQKGEISEVTLTTDWVRGKYKDSGRDGGSTFETARIEDRELVGKLQSKGVEFRGEPQNMLWIGILSWILPFALILLFWRMIFGRMAGKAQSGFLSMGKSRAKIYVEKDVKTTFSDVAGVDEAKEELREIVLFLKEPERYSRLGGRIPKGVLLVGPPGTGKTLIARAVAGESGVPFFSINGSEFVEMFVGLGAARVRDLFEQARKSAPCIIFIDELDALGKSRALQSPVSANDEKEQTLNQLLAELDGFDSSQGVILLGATNRPEILDPALLRAGRFDRQVLLDNPDRTGRLAILRIHSRMVKLAAEVDLEQIAGLTPGFSGADLSNLVNEAALVATRRNADAVTTSDFTQAIERIVAGLERRSRLINPDERRRVACHEMGHATVALALNTTDRVHKVSIIPRSIGALGYTLQRPTEDRYLVGRDELEGKIAVLLGGRAAEKLFLKDISTGAADDFAKATDIARAMVTRYGMSERLGLATLERQTSPYLGGQFGAPGMTGASERTLEAVDAEVRSILFSGLSLAEETLRRNHRFMDAGVAELLAKETLDEREIKDLWDTSGVPAGRGAVVLHEKKAH